MLGAGNKIQNLSGYLFWGAMGILLILGMCLFGLDGKRLIGMILLEVLAVIMHIYKMQKTPNYIKHILGLQSGKDRIHEYDWLRIFAVVMVMITHAIQIDLANGRIQDEYWVYILTVLYVFCMVCNVIYVMLSGALLMSFKKESLTAFYLHRAARILLPMLVYFVFCLWFNNELVHINFTAVKDILTRLFTGDLPESPHYWMIYTVLGIYIITPFFRYMFRNMPYKTLTAMVVISGIFMYFTTYSPIPCAVNPILSSWIGIAVSGYWVTRKETRKYDRLLIVAALVSFGITIYYIKNHENFLEICCNCSPTMLLISLGLFSMVFSFPKLFSKERPLLRILGKYSYSLILIHWNVICLITKETLHIYTDQYYYVGGILLSLVVTIMISFIAAFLVDNMVIAVITELYHWTIKLCQKLYDNLSL